MEYQELIKIIQKKEYYAVCEKEPRLQNKKNGIILSPFFTKEEAEQARIKYSYDNDNYYVCKRIKKSFNN